MVGEKEIYGGEYICEKMKSSCRSGRRMVTRVPQVSKSPSLHIIEERKEKVQWSIIISQN